MGQRSYVSGVRAASTSLKGLDVASEEAGLKARILGGSIAGLATPFNIATAAAKPLVGGLVVLGAVAATTGLKFDAAMEQSQIGMETLLKSGEQARKVVSKVTEIALKSPLLDVAESMISVQQLLGAGFKTKESTIALQTFSDTLSAMGRGPEQLSRLTYAFAQMSSKGQISAEELRGQLGEVFPASRLLARGLGISMKQLNKDMKKGAIKSATALPILLHEMQKEYGGATKKQAKTFAGMLSNFKENARYTLGIMFKPLFNTLKKDVFPEMNNTLKDINRIWSLDMYSTGEKFTKTWEVVSTRFGPLVDKIKDKISSMDLGGKLMNAIDWALPKILDKMGAFAPKAAKAFVTAWWHAGIWAKLFTLGLISSKLGLFNILGSKAAARFGSAWETAAAGRLGGAGTKTSKIGKAATLFGSFLGKTIGVAAAAYMAIEIAKSVPALNQYSGKKGWGELWKDLKHRAKQATDWVGSGSKNNRSPLLGPAPKGKAGPFGGAKPPGKMAAGGWASGWNWVGERGPELVQLPRGSYVYPSGQIPAPSLGGMSFHVTAPIYLKGREIARAVATDQSDIMARR